MDDFKEEIWAWVVLSGFLAILLLLAVMANIG